MDHELKSMWLKEGDSWNACDGGISWSKDYLRALAESVIRPGMVGFDTGCFTGSTASYVWPVFKAQGGHFYCVDWFKGNVNTIVGSFEWGKYPAETVLVQLLKNIEIGEGLDCVSVVVAESWRLAGIVADRAVDYVYIGGDHRYTHVKKDIVAWLPKIRPGGILCGHAFDKKIDLNSQESIKMAEEPEQDFYHSNGLHFGVTRAVQELLPGFEQGGEEIWAYRQPL